MGCTFFCCDNEGKGEEMENVKQNKMAEMPVNKLMLNMGIPMILSMMLQAAYNIVDSAFVANMQENGEAAINALTLVFPVQMFMVAIGIGTGVGANALIAKCLGAKDSKRAGLAAGNTLFLATVIYAVFLLFGIFGCRSYIASQTKNPLILEMGVDYLRICCVFSFGISYFSVLEKMLQATGKSLYSTIAQVTGAVCNIIFDPILIYGLLGFPRLGVRGAAYATVLGQIVSFLVALFAHLKWNKEIEKKKEYFKPSGDVIKSIYAIGVPAIIAQALMSVMTYLLNIILVKVSENMVTAYGLYYKIQQFILFAAFGLRDAITPIVAFNYGMGDKERVQKAIRCGLRYTLYIMLAGFVILEVFATPFSALFDLSGETQSLCISAIRIISLSFVFAGCNIAFQGVFQALDSGLPSLIVSVCRQFLFVVPVAYGFTMLVLHGNGVPSYIIWFTFLIAEGGSTIIALVFYKRVSSRRLP
jgi:multidrug efflux pump